MNKRVQAKTIFYSCGLCLLLLLNACGGGGGSATAPVAVAPVPAPTPTPTPTPTVPESPTFKIDGFENITEAKWDELAVRKVLHTFAYGGHASDSQILAWADMHPVSAISEMLTFDAHNEKLSPVSPLNQDNMPTRSGKLRDLAMFWASDDPGNGMEPEKRIQFDYENFNGWIEPLYPFATTVRGLNPFRQRVVYWEVNYHLAINSDNGIGALAIIEYFDNIAAALEAGKPYEEVLAIAASSTAIAVQYGHHSNRYVNGKCRCNEDFSREFYQLFFGITGQDDPEYHETITIKNTAKALTGMQLQRTSDGAILPGMQYGTDEHFPDTLEMMGFSIDGSNAKMRIDQLAKAAIDHPESLKNLPVMIIGGMADDNLTPQKIAQIRIAWASMVEKDLLTFIRAYAISTIFHNADRVKYFSSLERRLLITNKLSYSNDELYKQVYSVIGYVLEGVHAFSPVLNVFGGQTGEMASNSSGVFRQGYNQSTESGYAYGHSIDERPDYTWKKDWRLFLPSANGTDMTAKEIAAWLWNHFLADGNANMGVLEQAHLYALLGADKDLPMLLNPDDPQRIYTEAEITTNSAWANMITEAGESLVPLNSTNESVRINANYTIGQAVNFIVATPYIYYTEGL